MNSSMAALAARNNALWCDAVCRAHGRPGTFHETHWANRLGTPRFYPDAVTTAGAAAACRQRDALAELVGSDPHREWSVKDSFVTLRLEPLGFTPLFDAQWIVLRTTRRGPPQPRQGDRSDIAADDGGLSAWEKAWAGMDDEADLPRVFMPRLLAEDGIHFVSVQDEAGRVGGGILARAAGVVGVSNLFGSDRRRVWRSLIATAGRRFPGLPLVGYERGPDLGAAEEAGFETVGPLRIWIRPAAGGPGA